MAAAVAHGLCCFSVVSVLKDGEPVAQWACVTRRLSLFSTPAVLSLILPWKQAPSVYRVLVQDQLVLLLTVMLSF